MAWARGIEDLASDRWPSIIEYRVGGVGRLTVKSKKCIAMFGIAHVPCDCLLSEFLDYDRD